MIPRGLSFVSGYLLETPREYEYEEEDEVDDLMSSEDDTSVSLEDEENEDNNSTSESEGDLGCGDEAQIPLEYRKTGRKKLVGSKRNTNKVKHESDEPDDADLDQGSSDSSDENMTLEAMLTGDLDDSDDSLSGDNDWKPKKDKAGKKEKLTKARKKPKAKTSIDKTSRKPISQTLINLMHMKDIDEGSESDDSEWEPGVLVSKSAQNKTNGFSGISVDDITDAVDDAAEDDDDDDDETLQ